jgi:hypothetical protein
MKYRHKHCLDCWIWETLFWIMAILVVWLLFSGEGKGQVPALDKSSAAAGQAFADNHREMYGKAPVRKPQYLYVFHDGGERCFAIGMGHTRKIFRNRADATTFAKGQGLRVMWIELTPVVRKQLREMGVDEYRVVR